MTNFVEPDGTEQASDSMTVGHVTCKNRADFTSITQSDTATTWANRLHCAIVQGLHWASQVQVKARAGGDSFAP